MTPISFATLGWMCGPSLKMEGQGVLELLIGNEMVTDRPTCAKQYVDVWICSYVLTVGMVP